MTNLTLRPQLKSLFLAIISNFILSIFAAIIPSFIFVFYLAFAQKFGRNPTIENNQTLFTIYLVSLVLIYIFSLIKKYFYTKNTVIILNQNGLEISSSFISQAKHTLPHINLQSFEVNQNMFERIFNLGTLYIYTKGQDENYEFNGLDFNSASNFINQATREYKIKTG
jgi:uncharacterized membrane protein YdbT with pleckstrin-like domain